MRDSIPITIVFACSWVFVGGFERLKEHKFACYVGVSSICFSLLSSLRSRFEGFPIGDE